MSDKMQEWLSGKTGKADEAERKDYYSGELAYRKEKLDSIIDATEKWVNGPPDAEDPRTNDVIEMTVTVSFLSNDVTSPYNRSYVEPIDLDLIDECLGAYL